MGVIRESLCLTPSFVQYLVLNKEPLNKFFIQLPDNQFTIKKLKITTMSNFAESVMKRREYSNVISLKPKGKKISASSRSKSTCIGNSLGQTHSP